MVVSFDLGLSSTNHYLKFEMGPFEISDGPIQKLKAHSKSQMRHLKVQMAPGQQKGMHLKIQMLHFLFTQAILKKRVWQAQSLSRLNVLAIQRRIRKIQHAQWPRKCCSGGSHVALLSRLLSVLKNFAHSILGAMLTRTGTCHDIW